MQGKCMIMWERECKDAVNDSVRENAREQCMIVREGMQGSNTRWSGREREGAKQGSVEGNGREQ